MSDRKSKIDLFKQLGEFTGSSHWKVQRSSGFICNFIKALVLLLCDSLVIPLCIHLIFEMAFLMDIRVLLAESGTTVSFSNTSRV